MHRYLPLVHKQKPPESTDLVLRYRLPDSTRYRSNARQTTLRTPKVWDPVYSSWRSLFDKAIEYFVIQRSCSAVLYYFAMSIAVRKEPSASCHVGNGQKPRWVRQDLSKREFSGRFALVSPYSSVGTGRTLVSYPA